MKQRWTAWAQKDERGIAMIVVMLVMMVLLSLSLAVVQLSQHSTSSAQVDRRRAEAIHTAEAAINDWLAPLPSTTYDEICLDNGPSSDHPQYELKIELYVNGGWGAQDRVGCDGKNPPPTPALTGARITAKAVAGTADFIASTRLLQEEVDLEPLYSSALQNAVYGGDRVNISNNTTISEFIEPNDANVFSPGDIGCDYPRELGDSQGSVGFNAGFSLQGSLVSQGKICAASGSIFGNIWASDGIVAVQSLAVGYAGAPNGGNAVTFAGTITKDAASSGAGNAFRVEEVCYQPGGGVSSAFNDCEKPPACPPAVAAIELYGVGLCKDPATIGGIGFPDMKLVKSDWETYPPAGLGKFEVTGPKTCAEAQTMFESPGTLPINKFSNYSWVIDATGCTSEILVQSSGVENLRGHLALFTSGSVEFATQNTWQPASGSAEDWRLWIIHPSAELGKSFTDDCYHLVDDPGSNDPLDKISVTNGEHDIFFSNKTDFEKLGSVFAFTPCSIKAENNTSINGQLIGGAAVDMTNGGGLNFTKIPVPGLFPGGYKASPIFVREIKA